MTETTKVSTAQPVSLPPGATARSYPVELKVLYQSMEYPKNYSATLASNFTSGDFAFTACHDNRDGDGCHNNVKKLLEQYLSVIKPEIKPDVIILGEYTANKTVCNNVGTNYVLVGAVDLKRSNGQNIPGTRGMSIWVNESAASLHRISICSDRYTKDTLFYALQNDTQRSATGYLILREQRIAELSKQIPNIGPFIELMYKNRYIIFAHVLGCGPAARTNAAKLIADHNYIHLSGDLNALVNRNSGSTHNVSQKWGTMEFKANTDVQPLLLDSDYAKVQLQCNVQGKTASADTAHDGLYITTQARTTITSLGSIWAFIPEKDNKNYILMSDHKGFFLKITID